LICIDMELSRGGLSTPNCAVYLRSHTLQQRYLPVLLRRETKPGDFETLTSRIIDLFIKTTIPKGV